MTSFSSRSMIMHPGLCILFILCQCTAEEYRTPGTTTPYLREDDQINDVDHDVHIQIYNPKGISYLQSRINTSDQISTKSFVNSDRFDTTTLSDTTQTPEGLIGNQDAPDKDLTKGQTMKADQPKLITSATWKKDTDEGVLGTSDIDSELLKIAPEHLSRVKHQESNKNLPQLDTESPSSFTDEAEPSTVQDEVQSEDDVGGAGEQFTPTFPTEEDGSSSPHPPLHNGHVEIKISIPHIFHLSLGDTVDGRRQLGIQAPFFRLDLTRPRLLKVFKK